MNISPIESLVSLLAPSDCAICKRESDMLCRACRDTTYRGIDSRCYLCNRITNQHQVCVGCRSKSSLRRVWWLDEYKDITKQLIKELKFQRKRAYARAFGSILAEALPYLPDGTLVVPVPTANTRVRQRGFDQAVLVAQQFARQRGLAYHPLLRRLHQNDQIGKSRVERYQQMQHSFLVVQEKLPPKVTILLVDDVLTSGATLESAAKLLRRHGTAHVDACVIARHVYK